MHRMSYQKIEFFTTITMMFIKKKLNFINQKVKRKGNK